MIISPSKSLRHSDVLACEHEGVARKWDSAFPLRNRAGQQSRHPNREGVSPPAASRSDQRESHLDRTAQDSLTQSIVAAAGRRCGSGAGSRCASEDRTRIDRAPIIYVMLSCPTATLPWIGSGWNADCHRAPGVISARARSSSSALVDHVLDEATDRLSASGKAAARIQETDLTPIIHNLDRVSPRTSRDHSPAASTRKIPPS